MDVPSKITGNTLTASEFNQAQDELEQVILDSGQTLNAGDLTQLGKALANMTTSGNFYTDSGSGTSYVLSAVNGQNNTQYNEGMVVRFVADNNNTNETPTVNVTGLGVKNIIVERDFPRLQPDELTRLC